MWCGFATSLRKREPLRGSITRVRGLIVSVAMAGDSHYGGAASLPDVEGE